MHGSLLNNLSVLNKNIPMIFMLNLNQTFKPDKDSRLGKKYINGA